MTTSHDQAPVIGRTIAESQPAFAPRRRPGPGAPNVLMIVLDDTGFAQLGCFGSDLDTPHIDGLAAGGLRYNRFHVTALCSPTRACLLTGRNHHAVGMGFLTDVPIGFPGYDGRIPTSAATLPRLLRDQGYSTMAVGKWHLAPRWDLSASGPFTHWPLGLGFERYYGFLGGDTNQYAPELVRDNAFIDAPRSPEQGYHLTEDLADQAIRMILDQQQATPDKPFMCWFAPGAMHAPHHAPEEWIEPYRGRFDKGWDAWRAGVATRQQELGVVPRGSLASDRPAWVRAWDSLAPAEQRLFARQMEVFAGFLSHTDAQIGRLVGFLEQLGVLDNTIVMVLSDNGTSAEGGPHGSANEHLFTHDRLDDLDDLHARIDDLGGTRAYNHYSWGWAWAGNTPFRLWKRYTWLGGVRTPLVVHWPQGIEARGEVRGSFCHAVDLAPTLLDCAGVEAPDAVDGVAQQPFAGRSLRPSFGDASVAGRRTQYFEMLGSRAIYHDGWKATTDHVGHQLSVEMEQIEGSLDFADDRWSLFHLESDFAETDDRAERDPAVLADLVERWHVEAGANQVWPLDDSFIGRAGALEPAPFPPRGRAVFRPGGGPVNEDMLPPLGAGFRFVADLTVTEGTPAQGVLGALGDWNNGFACYLLDGVPTVALSLFGRPLRLQAPTPLGPGTHTVGFAYARTEGRTLSLQVDGETVAALEVGEDLPFRWQVAACGLLVGRDRGLPVSDDYQPPFACTADLHTVTIEVPALLPRPARDPGTTIAEALHRE